MNNPTPAVLPIFGGYGIELEYMLVDRETLAVAPVCDQVLAAAAGEITNDFDNGAIAWSNELALHVIEVKTNGPVPTLGDTLARTFTENLGKIDALAATVGARLLPGAMHPTMVPSRDTKLWPHDGTPIYSTYDRVFGCEGHGWSNLQSCHLNLPFGSDEEFGRLHAALRPLLPLLPALAASSPIVEGRITKTLDSRLAVYATNQRRIPSIIGDVIPEPVYTAADYQAQVLAPMYADIAPLDPDGELRYEWLNSRGAIARFERDAIEVRLLDVQEHAAADLAIARLVTAVAQALDAERWVPHAQLRALSSAQLRRILDATMVSGEQAIVDDPALLRALGIGEARVSAGELWSSLIEAVWPSDPNQAQGLRAALDVIVSRGPLSRRILRTLGADPRAEELTAVYRELADCLLAGRPFLGATL